MSIGSLSGRALGSLDYDDVLGVDMYKIVDKRVPVIYSGMLSGAHTIITALSID